MFYIDSNGVMVMIPWGTEAKMPDGGFKVQIIKIYKLKDIKKN